MPSTVVGHRFNDDLLVGLTDLAEARKQFPAIIPTTSLVGMSFNFNEI